MPRGAKLPARPCVFGSKNKPDAPDALSPDRSTAGTSEAGVEEVPRLRHERDRFLRRVLVEPKRDVHETVDKGVAPRTRDLILKLIDQREHELSAVAHRGGHVADENELGLDHALLALELDGHAAVAQVRAEGAAQIDLSLLRAAVAQGGAAAQPGSEAAHFLSEALHLAFAQATEREFHHVVDRVLFVVVLAHAPGTLVLIVLYQRLSARPVRLVAHPKAGRRDPPVTSRSLVELNAVVFEMATRHVLFGRFQVGIDGVRLEAEAWGEPVSQTRHQPAVEVKGATYTALSVQQAPDGQWQARCVVDV